MTFKEKLKQEHPEYVDNYKYAGGCRGCPHDYGYIEEEELTCIGGCISCWTKQIPTIENIGCGRKVVK